MRALRDSVGVLLVNVCRAHRNRAAALLGTVGLYVGQEWILFRLREEEGVTSSELAQRCDVEVPTMSKTLQRMEQAGVVLRREDKDDARITRIYLTKEGRALCQKVEQLWNDLEQQTVAGLSAEERLLLRRLLMQLRANLG
jgi:DNA-binding MarR family transcriptional regulator